MITLAFRWIAFAAIGLLCVATLNATQRVIVIVQEGLGHELIAAGQFYSDDASLWDWRLDHQWHYQSMATHPLTTQTSPDGTDPALLPSYDPHSAWDGTVVQIGASSGAPTSSFRGYRWLIERATDPLQAATALGSGIPSYNTAVNWMNYPSRSGSPLAPTQQLLEWADHHELQTALISDMPIGHDVASILAGFRSETRDTGSNRFNYLVRSSQLDLYVGAGHPRYNELGQAHSDPRYVVASQSDWQDLRNRARASGWNVIFGDENLLGVSSQPQQAAERRLVVLQFGDTTSTQAIAADASGLSENLANSMRFQIRMGLNFLNQSQKGFVAFIHLGRLPYLLGAELQREAIEEVVNGFRALTLCEDWIEANGGWKDTSLLMVSPYEYGLTWGAGSTSFPFAQITNRGKGRIPGFRLNHQGPSAALAPVLVRGVFAEQLQQMEQAEDPIYGSFLNASELGAALKRFITPVDSMVE